MTAFIIVLAVLMIASLVISGVVYTRQQALAQRESQTKHLKQNFQETEHIFNFIMKVDDQPDIAIALHNQLLDLAHQLLKINKKSEEFQSLFGRLKAQAAELKEGTLKPRGEQTVANDTMLQKNSTLLNATGQRLSRLKVRGLLPVAQYEEHLSHLKKLVFTIEYDSHMAMADKQIEDNNIVKAIDHLKHARDTLKKTRADIEDKNGKIKTLSDQIQCLLREGQLAQAVKDTSYSTGTP